jgi:hypothetical protein
LERLERLASLSIAYPLSIAPVEYERLSALRSLTLQGAPAAAFKGLSRAATLKKLTITVFEPNELESANSEIRDLNITLLPRSLERLAFKGLDRVNLSGAEAFASLHKLELDGVGSLANPRELLAFPSLKKVEISRGQMYRAATASEVLPRGLRAELEARGVTVT